MKFIIGFLLTVCLLSTSFSQQIKAQSGMPEDLRQQIIEAESKGVELDHLDTRNTLISYTSGILALLESKAHISVDILANTDVTTIMAFVYLEKKSGEYWQETDSWNYTVQSNTLSRALSDIYVPLKSTYRVRVSAYAYTPTKYEKIEFYTNTDSN